MNIFPENNLRKCFTQDATGFMRQRGLHIFHMMSIILLIKVYDLIAGVRVSNSTGRMRLGVLVHSLYICSVVFQRSPPGETGSMRTGGRWQNKSSVFQSEAVIHQSWQGYQCHLATGELSVHNWKLSGFLLVRVCVGARVCVCVKDRHG